MNYLWDNIFRRSRQAGDIRASLRENLLFSDLSDREMRMIEGIVHVRRYHAGEPVFRQGDVGVGMYIVVTGRVEVFMRDLSSTNENAEILITQLGAGDFFGELALVEENGRRSASATARDESTLIGFFKPDLLEVLSRSPSAGIKILSRLSEVLGRRLKETTDKISELRRALKEMREPPPLEADGSKTTITT